MGLRKSFLYPKVSISIIFIKAVPITRHKGETGKEIGGEGEERGTVYRIDVKTV